MLVRADDRTNAALTLAYANREALERTVVERSTYLSRRSRALVIAAKNRSREELTWESADLIFRLPVVLKRMGVSLDDVGGELLRRAK